VEGADGRPKNKAAEALESLRQPAFNNVGWHTDLDFEDVPATILMVLVQCAPAEGGETHLCDTAAAWEALESEEQLCLEGVRVLRRMEEGDVDFWMPMVQRDGAMDEARCTVPCSDRGRHTAVVRGGSDGNGGGEALLDRLSIHLTQPHF
jgi:hypothetical protein